MRPAIFDDGIHLGGRLSKAHQRPNQHRPSQGRQEQQNHSDVVSWGEPISAAVAGGSLGL
jgi:hypothetical protein